MSKTHNPASVAPPASRYSHGVEVEATRWLHISGQVGVKHDGSLAGDSEGQMVECWRRIFELLDSADMARENLVKVTAYLTDANDVTLYREVRDQMLDGFETASTLVIVAGLADPNWTVEIEAIAAAP